MNVRKLIELLIVLCLMMGVGTLAEGNVLESVDSFDAESGSDVVVGDSKDTISGAPYAEAATNSETSSNEEDVDTIISVEAVDQEYDESTLDLDGEDDTGLDQEAALTAVDGNNAVQEDAGIEVPTELSEATQSTVADGTAISDIESITIEGETQFITQEASAQAAPLFEGIVQETIDLKSLYDAGDLTITGIDDVSYTGSEITLPISVTLFEEIVLEEGKDYSVTYSGRINCVEGGHTVTINGLSPYSGELGPFTFNILPVSLNAGGPVTVTDFIDSMVFTGDNITQDIVLKIGDTAITNDLYSNYDLEYYNNRNAGTATLIISPKIGESNRQKYQNFTGERRMTFLINPASMNDIIVEGITEKTYNGSYQTQESLVVSLNGNQLLTRTDYSVDYAYNLAAGTEAKVVLKGSKNLDYQSKEWFFTINPASLTGAKVTCSPKTYTYDGNEKTPRISVTPLNEDWPISSTNYIVSYSPDNINVGTVIVTITGKENYTDTATGSFSINKAVREVTGIYTGPVPAKEYDKNAKIPNDFVFNTSDFSFIGVESGDEVQVDIENGNITARYDGVDVGLHNIYITSALKSTSNNYVYRLGGSIISDNKGTITPKPLTIRPGINQNGTLVSQTKVYGTSDPSSYKAKVAGFIEDDAFSVTGKLSRESGENVGKYRITIGTVKTMGNYATDPILEEAYFEITPKSLSDTDVEISDISDQGYTGSAIEPALTLKYKTKMLGTKTLVKGIDYEVEWSDNVDPGTATANIIGKGNYCDTCIATFNIQKPNVSLLDSNIKITPIGNQKYTGSEIEPSVTITYTGEDGNAQTLIQGTDYDVLYDNNIEVGIATVTLVGKGNFTGQRSIFFTIFKEGSDSSGSSSGTGSGSSSGTGSSSSSGTVSSPAPAPAAVVAQEPVTINKTPASTKAKAKKGTVTVTWKKIKKSKKMKALLGQIKSIQVQYSTDPNFATDVVTKSVGKKKTKVILKGLQRKTQYYIRVRYVGSDGFSNWGAVKAVKTK